jgi:folate-binding protein YgfZ
MRVYKLPDTVLRIKGNAAQFLNGITSNTLDAPLNAFLNQRGRIIATFRQQKVSDSEFLIFVPRFAVDNLLKHLERYAKLSRTTIEKLSQNVYMDLDSIQPIVRAEDLSNSISDEEFVRFRLEHNIPFMGVDYQADEFILNVDEHKYTSYTKGCFLGQEPVAKVHNRSKPTRKLVAAFEDEISPDAAAQMTSKVRDPQSVKTRGFVFLANKTA